MATVFSKIRHLNRDLCCNADGANIPLQNCELVDLRSFALALNDSLGSRAEIAAGYFVRQLRSRHLTFQPNTVSPTAFGALATVIPLDEMDPISDWA